MCSGNNGINSLYLLGIFVADENDDGVDVNAVQTLDGVRSDVEQTVAVLKRGGRIQKHSKRAHQVNKV